MEYTIKCTGCGARINTDTKWIGKPARCKFCKAEFKIPLTPMTTGMVQGDYWLQRNVGQGNIADVFVAKQNSTGERVFIKYLTRAAVPDEETARRYLSPIFAWQQVVDPHVITPIESGLTMDHYYVTTRYVEGEYLNERLERDGPTSPKDALKIILQVARIMRKVWQQYGLVHGDLRPSNVMIGLQGDAYLLDGGNFKRRLIPGTAPLEPIDFGGDIADFMSPEEASGEMEVDCSADIYCLGCTLYALLAGHPPYAGKDADDVADCHVDDPPPPLPKDLEIDPKIGELVLAMMQKKPADRFRSWRALTDYVKTVLRGMSGVDAAIVETTQMTVPRASASAQLRRQNNHQIWILAGALALVFVLFTGVAVYAAVKLALPQTPQPPLTSAPAKPEPGGKTPQPKTKPAPPGKTRTRVQAIHRWSFNGTLEDSIGETHAKIIDPDRNSNKGGECLIGASDILMHTGPISETEYVELGSGFFNDGKQFSIEIWATPLSVNHWSRIFEYTSPGVGGHDDNFIFMSWSVKKNPGKDRVEWYDSSDRVSVLKDGTNAPYQLNKEYHIVITLDSTYGGSTMVRWYTAKAEAKTIAQRGYFSFPKDISSLDPDGILWLGRSSHPQDQVAHAHYNEVRIWRGILSAAQVQKNHEAGPN